MLTLNKQPKPDNSMVALHASEQLERINTSSTIEVKGNSFDINLSEWKFTLDPVPGPEGNFTVNAKFNMNVSDHSIVNNHDDIIDNDDDEFDYDEREDPDEYFNRLPNTSGLSLTKSNSTPTNKSLSYTKGALLKSEAQNLPKLKLNLSSSDKPKKYINASHVQVSSTEKLKQAITAAKAVLPHGGASHIYNYLKTSNLIDEDVTYKDICDIYPIA